jgi:hypothetical protein
MTPAANVLLVEYWIRYEVMAEPPFDVGTFQPKTSEDPRPWPRNLTVVGIPGILVEVTCDQGDHVLTPPAPTNA